MKLDGSISAVVTGGASGLGKATVTALREQGVKPGHRVGIYLHRSISTAVAFSGILRPGRVPVSYRHLTLPTKAPY